MIRYKFAALTLVILANAIPASASVNCDAGYKSFLEKLSPTIPFAADSDLGMLMRRGLSVYDACAAGDMFSPTGIWEKIAADLEASTHKK